MFNKPKKHDKEKRKEWKGKEKKNQFRKKLDKKAKYATGFRKPKLTLTFDLDARR